MAEAEEPLLLYRPHIFVSRDQAGKWQVSFDWEDCFIGYQSGYDFVTASGPNDPIYPYLEEADEFLTEFLMDEGMWDVSVS